MNDNETLRRNLRNAIEAFDDSAFELAVRAIFRAGLPSVFADVFSDALVMPWHTRHEDLASALQTMKSPESVDALFCAATSSHPYLDFDELFGLARKCTWALADIGTPAARNKLTDLANNPNPVIAGYARKRLERWDEELPRKTKQP